MLRGRIEYYPVWLLGQQNAFLALPCVPLTQRPLHGRPQRQPPLLGQHAVQAKERCKLALEALEVSGPQHCGSSPLLLVSLRPLQDPRSSGRQLFLVSHGVCAVHALCDLYRPTLVHDNRHEPRAHGLHQRKAEVLCVGRVLVLGPPHPSDRPDHERVEHQIDELLLRNVGVHLHPGRRRRCLPHLVQVVCLPLHLAPHNMQLDFWKLLPEFAVHVDRLQLLLALSIVEYPPHDDDVAAPASVERAALCLPLHELYRRWEVRDARQARWRCSGMAQLSPQEGVVVPQRVVGVQVHSLVRPKALPLLRCRPVVTHAIERELAVVHAQEAPCLDIREQRVGHVHPQRVAKLVQVPITVLHPHPEQVVVKLHLKQRRDRTNAALVLAHVIASHPQVHNFPREALEQPHHGQHHALPAARGEVVRRVHSGRQHMVGTGVPRPEGTTRSSRGIRL
mmetsp:Transcript_21952/g.74640  ORF Transcript_21952/g.74640 Transcript_21952/m.74640 type:complete len:450 (-) Transcript_21952:426-1775(-)